MLRTSAFGRFLRQNAVALVALFLAMGGTSFAAASYVNGSQIRPHSIPKNRLTSEAISQLKGNRGPQGPRGFAGLDGLDGLQGPPGVQGPPGTNASTHVVIRLGLAGLESADHHFVSGAFCHSGEVATGGGYAFPEPDPAASDDIIELSYPEPATGGPTDGSIPTGWAAQIFDVNADDPSFFSLKAYVICASP